MKRMTPCLLLVVLWALPAIAKKYENKQYRPVVESLPMTVAIMPIGHEDPIVKAKLDSFFFSLYTDTGKVHPAGPSSFREEIANDSLFAALLEEIARYEYSKEQRKSGPTIGQILDSGETHYLTNAIGGADLLLIPIKFGIGSILGRPAGEMSLRLYDMRSGVLIYEKDQDLNVDVGGDVGRDYIILGLIAFTRDPYHKFLLDHIAGSGQK